MSDQFERNGVKIKVIAHFSLNAEGHKVVDRLILVDAVGRDKIEQAAVMLNELSAAYVGKTELEWAQAKLDDVVVLTNRERLLIVAESLEGFYSEIEGAMICAKQDAKTLREIADSMCEDGCDGG